MATITDIEFDHVKFAKMLKGSIAENAREIGISRQHLLNILQGRRRPSAPLLLKLQELYKIEAGELLKRV
jgi:transcriptional regulator with XRE-family HTH domain